MCYIIMNPIVIKGCIFKRHPIFDTYAASKDGYIIDINKQVKIEAQYHNGYLYVILKCKPCEKYMNFNNLFGNVLTVSHQ